MSRVVEMTDAEVSVHGWLNDMAMLLDSAVDESEIEFPLEFMTQENLVECTAVLYERFNGSVILRIDASLGDVKDTAAVREWVLTAPGHLPFVQIRFERRHRTVWSRVVATHSVAVEGLSKETLGEIVSSFDFIVPKWLEKIREIDAAPEAPAQAHGGTGPNSGCTGTDAYCDDYEEHLSGGSPAGRDRDAETECSPDQSTESSVDQVLAELQALVGLAPVKQLVGNLADMQRVARMRALAGLNPLRPSPHLVFTGNPGTGKTTVARLVGRLYRELGLLKRGHVVETGRHGLVGGYVGQTAIKTQEVLESARDGVLFIDEAYSLAVDHHLDYGREAIETILAFMENNRGSIAVVVAGYPAPMERFLNANAGLASRFDYTIGFPDFSNEELLQVFQSFAEQHNYVLGPGAHQALLRCFASWPRDGAFPNGRGVRKLFNETVVIHSHAVMQAGPGFGDMLTVIGPEHIPASAVVSDGFIPVGYL